MRMRESFFLRENAYLADFGSMLPAMVNKQLETRDLKATSPQMPVATGSYSKGSPFPVQDVDLS